VFLDCGLSWFGRVVKYEYGVECVIFDVYVRSFEHVFNDLANDGRFVYPQ